MHRSMRDVLEDLLAGKSNNANGSRGLGEHLSSCCECSNEFKDMQAQSELFRSLGVAGELDPAPGFYARVMQSIEEHARNSIWAVFIYSPFGKRLALASFTLALALGSYVVVEESRDGHLTESVVAQQLHYDAPVVGSPDQQRDAVLENFASHDGNQE